MSNLSALKICFLAGTLGQGGAERQLYYILQALRDGGASLRLLSLTRGEFWEESIRKLGVEVIWVGASNNPFFRLGRIVNELRRDLPDVFQSQNFYTNFYVGIAARLLGIKGIGAIRSDGFQEVQQNGLILGRLCLILPHLLAANSYPALTNVQNMWGLENKSVLLPNVVDTTSFYPLPISIKKHSSVCIFAAGRLSKPKRFDCLITTLACVRSMTSVKFKVVIAGDGPFRETLERQAADLGLLSEIKFVGALADLTPIYGQADIFVLLSDWEGTPNVIMEAMASGLPVVASRVGGIPDLVVDGLSGFLVQLNNIEEIAGALVQLIKDPILRRKMGEKGQEIIENRYSKMALKSNLEQLYQLVMK